MLAINTMQQIPFINLFKSALHVSGDKLAHPQEHFCLNIQLLVHCTVPKAVYTVKSVPEDGRVCRPKHVEQI